jgi:hypothetical protein
MGRQSLAGPLAGKFPEYHADEFAGIGVYQCGLYRRTDYRVMAPSLQLYI